MRKHSCYEFSVPHGTRDTWGKVPMEWDRGGAYMVGLEWEGAAKIWETRGEGRNV